MNIKNMLKLADLVERQEYSETLLSIGFNMSSCWHPCGTPSCIAGFASAQSGGTKSDGSTFSRAMKWLDINQDVARALFIPKGNSLSWQTSRPQWPHGRLGTLPKREGWNGNRINKPELTYWRTK